MSDNSSSVSVGGGGIGLGSILAVILSWTTNHSIAWCILHFFCSWFYVIYWAIVHAT
jgi:hypothetical protein